MSDRAFEDWVTKAKATRVEDELARRGTKLVGKNERAGPCPKCGGDDRFSINCQKQVWNCRGCDKGGDIIELVQHLDGSEFVPAVEKLAGSPPPKRMNGAGTKVNSSKPAGSRQMVATYDYRDAGGVLVSQVLRFEPKQFRQRRLDPDNPKGLIWGLGAGDYMRRSSAPGNDWHAYNEEGWSELPPTRERKTFPGLDKVVPYRLPELIEAISSGHTILIPEGEKDCDNLAKLAVPATCNAMGAGKWRKEHAAYLAGANVVVVPDNDDKGRKHADAVARSLQGIAARVRLLELPDLPPNGDISDWIAAGGTREQLDALVEQARDWQQEAEPPPRVRCYWEPSNEPPILWLVKKLIPEVGIGRISGQWGTYKTFVAIELAGAIMTGSTFLGRPISRKGGVLFLAAEAHSQLRIRVDALHTKISPNDKLPFTDVAECPCLLDKDAAARIIAIAQRAAAKIRAAFDLPLVAIIIDTITAAAGYAPGQEDDAAIAQNINRVMMEVATKTGTFVFGLDHFGKAIETGTRGSSAKEDGVDVVLALLGEKSVSGKVTNTRMALRKLRSADPGEEYPFTMETVELSQDEEGAPETSLVVNWDAPAVAAKAKNGDSWPTSLRTLRQAVLNALGTAGKEQRPMPDGPMVRAVDIEIVRGEFYNAYPAMDGTPEQRRDAKRQAFNRAVKAAQSKGVVGIRANANQPPVLWLVRGEAA
jgi:hypothetical protein